MSDPNQRRIPQNELEVYMQTTDPVFGKFDVPPQLKTKLERLTIVKDKDGRPIYDKTGNPIVGTESLWDLLGMYTRDMRLANLSEKSGELGYVQYYLDLAKDCLLEGYVKAFITALGLAATRLELSQSKNGFLRKQMNTLTQENVNKNIEPPKKSLFGGSKQPSGKS